MSIRYALTPAGRGRRPRPPRIAGRLVAIALMGVAIAVTGCGAAAVDAGDTPSAERAVGSSLPKRLPASRGTKRYVSPDGSDRSRGTAAAPWRTVQKALNTLRPGQTAIVRAGTYRQNLVADRAGRKSAPITISGEPGAVLAAGSGAEENMPLEMVDGAAFLRFEGLVFEGATGDSTTNVYADRGVHDIELSRCEVRRSQRQGFFSEADTARIQILRCRFHDNGGSGPEGLDHSIYVQGSRHVIAGNLLTGARNGNGIQLYPSSDNAIIVGNTIDDNLLDGVVIGDDDGRTTSDALVANNIVTRSRSAVATYWGGAVGRGNVVRNNLGWRNDRRRFAGEGAVWVGNRTADPRFVDAAAGDYHLSAGSPAIGRALERLTLPVDIDGRRRLRGVGRPDLGAYER